MITPQLSGRDIRIAAKQGLVWLINVIGIAGIFLIAYGVVAQLTGSDWPIMENIAQFTSSFLTLVAVGMIALSIYVPRNYRPPDPFSIYISAPAVLVGVTAAIAVLLLKPALLPPHVVNGFALLAISGALFRLLSR